MTHVGTSSVNYWYEDSNEIIIHKKTLYNRMKAYNFKNKCKLTEAEYAILSGLSRYYYAGKLKFVKRFT